MNNNQDLKKEFSKITPSVNTAILRIIFSSVDNKYKNLVKYQILAGGKRLRPVIAILSSKMMGGKLKDIIYPAACLEILHNYTLIVDDLIDRSELRRGKPTVWKKYGKGIADCVSMSYAASIFDIPISIKKKERVYYILAKTLKAITDGQVFDILFEQGGRQDENYVLKNRYKVINLKNYYKMTGNKTASLFRACMEMGGVCAGANVKKIKYLRDTGYNLGIAYQIQDDILDIFGDEKKFGKQIGKDIEERKLGNIVMLLAMQEFSQIDKKIFLNILKKKKITKSDIKEGIRLIKKTRAHELAIKLEMKYIKKAEQSLANLPKNKWNKIILDLMNYLVDRKV